MTNLNKILKSLQSSNASLQKISIADNNPLKISIYRKPSGTNFEFKKNW